jgi:starch phosphorylase
MMRQIVGEELKVPLDAIAVEMLDSDKVVKDTGVRGSSSTRVHGGSALDAARKAREEILKIAKNIGPLQIVLAGKAHPNDNIGGAHIDAILDHIDALNNHYDIVKVLILENYDTYFGKLLSNSVDVWLNNPLRPLEASGTSGMKAILNGVVQCSTLDGWVVEAEHDDIGWIFGYRHEGSEIGSESDLRLDEDSAALYSTIDEMARLYYQTNQHGKVNVQSAWINKMINCVRRAAFFNTQRMIEEYNSKMWELNK